MSKKSTPMRREAHVEAKIYKTFLFGGFLGIVTLKKCTPLRREAHFQVIMYKARHSWSTFGS
jgi:hypothetical protein